MVNKKALKEMGRKTFCAVKTAMELAVSSAYFGPTSIRKMGDKVEASLNVALFNTFHILVPGGVSLIAYPTAQQETPDGIFTLSKYLLFVAGTHILSGLYEWYRYEKNKVSPSTTSTSTSSTGKKSGLEEAVKESSETNHPIDPKTYKNPFEIELPKNDKIESLVYGGNE